MFEEFILNACLSFGRRDDTIIEKKNMADIFSKFTVLCLSFDFVIYFLELKLILFYNRVVYYYTRIFGILLPHSIYSYFLLSNFTVWLYIYILIFVSEI